jgi:hypothetical protein
MGLETRLSPTPVIGGIEAQLWVEVIQSSSALAIQLHTSSAIPMTGGFPWWWEDNTPFYNLGVCENALYTFVYPTVMATNPRVNMRI